MNENHSQKECEIEFCFSENDAEFREKNIKICENFKRNWKKKFRFCVNLFQENKQNFPKLAKFLIFFSETG